MRKEGYAAVGVKACQQINDSMNDHAGDDAFGKRFLNIFAFTYSNVHWSFGLKLALYTIEEDACLRQILSLILLRICTYRDHNCTCRHPIHNCPRSCINTNISEARLMPINALPGLNALCIS